MMHREIDRAPPGSRSSQVTSHYYLLTVTRSHWTLISPQLSLVPCSTTCQYLSPLDKSLSGLDVQIYPVITLLLPSLSLLSLLPPAPPL